MAIAYWQSKENFNKKKLKTLKYAQSYLNARTLLLEHLA